MTCVFKHVANDIKNEEFLFYPRYKLKNEYKISERHFDKIVDIVKNDRYEMGQEKKITFVFKLKDENIEWYENDAIDLWHVQNLNDYIDFENIQKKEIEWQIV